MRRAVLVGTGVLVAVGYSFWRHYSELPEDFHSPASMTQVLVWPHLLILGVCSVAFGLAYGMNHALQHGGSGSVQLRGALAWGVPVGLATGVVRMVDAAHYNLGAIGLEPLMEVLFRTAFFGLAGAVCGRWLVGRAARGVERPPQS